MASNSHNPKAVSNNQSFKNVPNDYHKLVRKTKKVDEYRAAVDRVFREQPLAPVARFHG